MVVAYGGSAKEAALNGQVIKARRLEEIAAKPVKRWVDSGAHQTGAACPCFFARL